MNVFDLDRTIVCDGVGFARSFTQIRAVEMRTQVEAIYATNRFWPESLVSINPHFEPGASAEEPVEGGALHRDAARPLQMPYI